MIGEALAPNPVEQLAQRLERDIRQRSLRTGESYYSTTQAGQMLGVSTATAHRAMQLLVQRQVLIRKTGRGTFVGPAIKQTPGAVVPSLSIMFPAHRQAISRLPLQDLFGAIHHEMGRVAINYHDFPIDQPEVVTQLLDEFKSRQRFAGVLAIACGETVYRQLAASGLPAVVLGSLPPSIEGLASIDKNSHQAGRLLTEYLLARGHQRFAVLPVAEGLAGTDLFLDAVSESLARANLPPTAMKLRSCSGDVAVTEARVRQVLSAEDRPTAVIADGSPLASLAQRAAESLGLQVGRDVEIVFQASALAHGLDSPFVHTQPILELRQVIHRAVEMLSTSRAEPTGARSVVIEVELRLPAREAAAGN